MPGTLWQDETKLKAWYLILRKWDIQLKVYLTVWEKVYIQL